MHGVSKYKIPGGKLVEVRLDYGSVIEKVQILGDFFLYPEESLSYIENGLLDTKIEESEEALSAKIQKIAKSKRIEMIGITAEGIAKAIKMAVEK